MTLFTDDDSLVALALVILGDDDTPEAVEHMIQHLRPLVEAAETYRERSQSYGQIWSNYGARANLLNAARKIDRLMESWWKGEGIPALHKDNLDDAIDALNYLTFFIRCARDGNLTGDKR